MKKEIIISKLMENYEKNYVPRIKNEPPKTVKHKETFLDMPYEYEETIYFDNYYITLQFIQNGFLLLDFELWEQIKESREKKEWEALNNCVFQRERIDLLRFYEEYYSYDFPWLLFAYACGDIETTKHILPIDLPLCDYGYPFYVAGCNLIRTMQYNDMVMFEKIKPDIKKFIQGKAARWERSAIAFLYAVIEKDFDNAEVYLFDICKSYKRASEPFGVSKDFCMFAHGVYCVAMEYLSEEDFLKLKMPDIDNFDREYASWRFANRTVKPKAYYTLPKSAELVNLAFEIPIPNLEILRENGKGGHLNKDGKRMEKQFVKELESQDKNNRNG